ncbi:DUF2867 domain-containing protein [Streptomyces sp. DSM 44915]|uniref:DUF2867 domain-containing protein n=1 Tax=Streptomyces chisholmiae TaxID=3075540 RepID=A0ABU2JZW0_9ACTN|nr:DUF2867 domain-containing protein [Streptomyces sp. DSM 44915]MDT0270482.1 DUF2867 domain-containing protein [Streptomyces sp. DSM 44915]
MRLPNAAHTSLPWRVHEIAGDFRVDDVWALPTPGGPDDLHHLVTLMANGGKEPAERPGEAAAVEPGAAPEPGITSPVYRALFAIRWRLGRWFGWDRPGSGLDGRVSSLRERLPADLRAAPRGPDFRSVPFTSVYQLPNEWAAELANRTVHTVLHVGWVSDGAGGYRGQMAVLVKRNGRFGAVYMAAIRPFRHLGVYPALFRAIDRRWRATTPRR